MIIIIDSREHNAPYISKRFTEAGIENEITCLPQETGSDFLIASTHGSVAVQRKVVCSEMIGQLDEIMYEIIPRMKNFNENPIILLEENYGISKDGYLFNKTDNRPTEMLAKSYFGYLETIRKMGVGVITTRGLTESIWYLVSVHDYLSKEHYPKHMKCFTDKEYAIGILSMIPTVGTVRAAKTLSNCSIRAMVGMKKINGLTQSQSDRFARILHWTGK